MLQPVQRYQSQKKTIEEIEKSTYYRNQLFDHLFSEHSNQIKIAKHGKLCYYYGKSSSSSQCLSTFEAIRECFQKIYLSAFEVSRLNRQMYRRKVSVKKPYMLLFGQVEEVLHFYMQEKNAQKPFKDEKQLILHIVHHCNHEASNVKWLNFVQSYYFQKDSFQYEISATIKLDDSYFASNQKLFQQFLQENGNIGNPQKMQGLLLQYQSEIKSQIGKSKDPAFNPQHRILNKLKPEHLKMYYSLQKQFPEQKQDLICRYLIAKQYDLAKTRQLIKKYSEWYKQITKKYTYQDFQEFHELGIFKYIGQDHSGRPVIVNKAKNVKPDEINIQKYCQYYIYYLEVYIPSKMRGYVSQLLIIADVEDLGSENFKLSVTKRNMEDSVSLCPERQYKMIGINVSSFAMYWWRLMSPLLPKKTLEKIELAGADRVSIFRSLQNQMDPNVIPQYLGGLNPIQFP